MNPTTRLLILAAFPVLLFSSCANHRQQALLRVRVDPEAWTKFVEGPSPVMGYGFFHTPYWAEYTRTPSFSNEVRRYLRADGFDPEIPIHFRWVMDGWTNALLTISSREVSSKFRASVSNGVTAYFSDHRFGGTLTITEP